MKIDTKFDIGDTINIKPLNENGKVLGITLRSGYTEYRVVYWFEGKRCDEWLLEEELA